MRVWLAVLLSMALAGGGWAQEPGGGPAKKAGDDDPQPGAGKEAGGKKKGEAEAAEAWRLPDRDAKKLAAALENYLAGGKKRPDGLKKLEKLATKRIGGHSVLEDVPAIVAMANRLRQFNPRPKKGRIEKVEVRPEVHGFPGGIGTVVYWLWVPKRYDPRQLWPLLYCLPDNKKHTDAKKYIQETWIDRSPVIAERYIVAMPEPQKKGESWTSPKSQARAMIALRHVSGSFGVGKKTAGPAVNMLRMFVDGGDAAAVVAARFPEMLCGAVLHGCDGSAPDSPDIRRAGRLSGLPVYAIYDAKQTRQREFAEALQADNERSALESVDQAGMLGSAETIAAWMEKLPARDTQPRQIEYAVHDSSFQRHYWITVLEFDASVEPAAMFTATADRVKNEVRIDVTGITRFELFLNDALVDLSKPLRIVVVEDDKELPFFATEDGTETASRDLGTMLEELVGSNHPWRIYPTKYVVDVPRLRRRAAEKEAQEKAAKEKEDASGKAEGAAESSPKQSSSR